MYSSIVYSCVIDGFVMDSVGIFSIIIYNVRYLHYTSVFSVTVAKLCIPHNGVRQ